MALPPLALAVLALGARARAAPPSPDAPPEGNATSEFARFSYPGPPAPPNVELPWGPSDCFVKRAWKTGALKLERDVVYGRAYDPYKNKTVKLLMDVVFPPEEDQRAARPVVVFLHGGGFVQGKREEDINTAKVLASRGYVAVTVKYRMVPGYKAWHLWSAEPAVLAVEDARAAVRFMRKNAAKWRLDTSRIAIGGESAGAISALYYAYARKNSDGSPVTEGESGNPEYSSVVHAVVSISGTMVDHAFCAYIGSAPEYAPSACLLPGPPILPDFTPNMDADGIPGIDMHGTADHVVPYAGGLEWARTAAAKGVRHFLLTVPGAGHTPKKELYNEKKPYLAQWLTFLSGALNLKEATCPGHDAEPLLV
uniref:BD-FAE-like domain-containing protein n=1 Tax=Alexandrium catenella TaxID=2925 RepID=A0A7S1M2X3_ALECA